MPEKRKAKAKKGINDNNELVCDRNRYRESDRDIRRNSVACNVSDGIPIGNIAYIPDEARIDSDIADASDDCIELVIGQLLELVGLYWSRLTFYLRKQG